MIRQNLAVLSPYILAAVGVVIVAVSIYAVVSLHRDPTPRVAKSRVGSFHRTVDREVNQ